MADDKLKTGPEPPGPDRPGDAPVKEAPPIPEAPGSGNQRAGENARARRAWYGPGAPGGTVCYSRYG